VDHLVALIGEVDRGEEGQELGGWGFSFFNLTFREVQEYS
jgi:hypothetical protein